MGHLSKADMAAIRRGAWCNDTRIPDNLNPGAGKPLPFGMTLAEHLRRCNEAAQSKEGSPCA